MSVSRELVRPRERRTRNRSTDCGPRGGVSEGCEEGKVRRAGSPLTTLVAMVIRKGFEMPEFWKKVVP